MNKWEIINIEFSSVLSKDSKMCQKERDPKQESFSVASNTRSLGVMKKKGYYHLILENYITTG